MSTNRLPLVRLSDDAEVLNSILTMPYTIPSVMPNSYDECLMLLAASQKYDMVGVQSHIRAKIRAKHGCQTGTNEPKLNDIAPQTRDYRAHWPRSRHDRAGKILGLIGYRTCAAAIVVSLPRKL